MVAYESIKARYKKKIAQHPGRADWAGSGSTRTQGKINSN